MAVCLTRPTSAAPLRLHLYHFLKFVVQISPNVGEYKTLLVATLEYLKSIALSSTYKVKIQSALHRVVSAMSVTSGSTAQQNIEEYSCLYKDLMDRIVQSTDQTWELPKRDSNPSEDVIKMDTEWQHARAQLEISTTWDLTS